MKKTFHILLLCSFALLAGRSAEAQIRTLSIRVKADVTLKQSDPDRNLGYHPNNAVCNCGQETWLKFDLQGLSGQLLPGEEILYAEVMMRVSWNATGGIRVIHLRDDDNWNEGNGTQDLADNLDGITWNKAITMTPSIDDPAFHDTLYTKEHCGLMPTKEYFPVLSAVQSELSDTGNQLMTLRIIPYADTTEEEAWLGFISLQSPASAWNLEVDDEGYPVEAPHLLVYAGIAQQRFSDYVKMGDTAYYNFTPSSFGTWLVESDENDLRLHLAEKTSVDTNTWKPAAFAIFRDTVFEDPDIRLTAKMNYVTPSGIFFPYNDFIVIFGYTDENNFSYFAFYGDDESGTFRIIDGKRYRVGEANPMPALSDTLYHSYQIVKEGATVTAYIDSTEYFTVTNDSLDVMGKVGIGSHNDPVFFDDIHVDGYSQITGIRAVASASSVRVFPTLTRDVLTVRSRHPITAYQIVDMNGKKVLEKQISPATRFMIDLAPVSPGVYLIRLTEEGKKVVVTKCIKQ